MTLFKYFCLALTFAAPVAAETWEIPTDAFDPSLALPDRPQFDETSEADFEATLKAAVAQNDLMAARRPDLESLSLDLMLDPEAAFAFFRDEIVTEAYPGHLRAPRAVLEAGAGNAYDKSLALADVLQGMGYDTRLMTAKATPEIAAEIAAGSCTGPSRDSGDVFRIAGLTSDVMSRVRARAHASYSALAQVAAPPVGAAPSPARSPDHFWVQARIGTDWVDLDPALPDTAFGQSAVSAGTEVTSPPKPHQVRVTLTLETLRNGKLRTDDILNHTFDLPRNVERQVSLLFGPEHEGVGGLVSETLSALQGGSAEMVATLLVGMEPKKSRAFAAPGVAAAVGGLFDAGPEEEITTAMTLRLTGLVPGQPDAVTLRPIFDIVPADLRDSSEPIPPEALGSIAMGRRYPVALESLRHIVLGNGGQSAHVASVRVGAMLGDLPEAFRLFQAGTPDPQSIIWNGWVQASTVALVSEELIRARPVGEGCTTMTRPRALIWGVSAISPDLSVYWYDWALDDVDIANATDAPAAWRMKLWHGALQAGLEREAILNQLAAPTGSIAVDPGAMQEPAPEILTRLGPEAAADRAEGFDLFTAPGLSVSEWWRVDPLTGRADARFAFYGNSGPFVPQPGHGITRLGEAAIDRLSARYFHHGTEANWRAYMQRVMHDAEQLAKKWEVEDRLKRSRGNEYLIILLTVSIPISLEAGAAIGGTVNQGVIFALYG